MRGGALPPALICAALAFALSYAPRRAVAPAFVAVVAAALAGSLVRFSAAWDDEVFFGCWASVILTAGAVHLPHGVGRRTALALALNAGLWAGATVAAAGVPLDLAKALPLVLLGVPGGWLVATGKGIAIKVVASWLVAVSILTATLSIVPLTPGYRPDHLE